MGMMVSMVHIQQNKELSDRASSFHYGMASPNPVDNTIYPSTMLADNVDPTLACMGMSTAPIELTPVCVGMSTAPFVHPHTMQTSNFMNYTVPDNAYMNGLAMAASANERGPNGRGNFQGMPHQHINTDYAYNGVSLAAGAEPF